jgi:hypothetical protein
MTLYLVKPKKKEAMTGMNTKTKNKITQGAINK